MKPTAGGLSKPAACSPTTLSIAPEPLPGVVVEHDLVDADGGGAVDGELRCPPPRRRRGDPEATASENHELHETTTSTGESSGSCSCPVVARPIGDQAGEPGNGGDLGGNPSRGTCCGRQGHDRVAMSIMARLTGTSLGWSPVRRRRRTSWPSRGRRRRRAPAAGTIRSAPRPSRVAGRSTSHHDHVDPGRVGQFADEAVTTVISGCAGREHMENTVVPMSMATIAPVLDQPAGGAGDVERFSPGPGSRPRRTRRRPVRRTPRGRHAPPRTRSTSSLSARKSRSRRTVASETPSVFAVPVPRPIPGGGSVRSSGAGAHQSACVRHYSDF